MISLYGSVSSWLPWTFIADHQGSPKSFKHVFHACMVELLPFAESPHHACNAAMLAKRRLQSETFFPEKYHLDVIADRTLRKPLLHYTQQNFWSCILGRSNRQAIHL